MIFFFIFFDALLLTLVVLLFLPFYLLFMIDMLIRGHDLPTSKHAQKEICRLIFKHRVNNKRGNFYDLGCARGAFAVAMKRAYPHFSIYAVDNSALRLFFAKMRAYILKNEVTWQKADIFDIDLRNADIVYTYLWYDLMPPLEKKLQRELKRGALVITNTSHFFEWQPIEVHITNLKIPEFEKLFVYLKN